VKFNSPPVRTREPADGSPGIYKKYNKSKKKGDQFAGAVSVAAASVSI
jgi:hypothetical protein